MRVVVVGAGAVGARASRQLHASGSIERLCVIDIDRRRRDQVVASLGSPVVAAEWSPGVLRDVDAVIIATEHGHRAVAEAALEAGAHVVSTADGIDEVRSLLLLDAEARERHLSVAVGAGFGPGLSCVLARHAATGFDQIDELHVAKAGAGGPSCARNHHRALRSAAIDWRDGAWQSRPGGSGRELCWFPDPIGALDCYRAGLPDALLLVGAFPGVRRVTARVAASRRDRLTSHLPMLRPPHPEGLVGAVRVEVRGGRGGSRDVKVLGVLDRPAMAAGAVAATVATWAVDGRLARAGAAGLAELVTEPVPFLQELATIGVRAAVFDGSTLSTGLSPGGPPDR